MGNGRPRLGDFIRNINFLEVKWNSDYSSNDLNPRIQLDKFVTSILRELTFDEVKDAFSALVEKVAIHDYPNWYSQSHRGTGPHFMAIETAELLVKQMGRLVDEYDDDNLTLAAGEVRLQSWLAIMAVGPHKTHHEVMEIIVNGSRPTMKDYIPSLPPSQIVTILRAMDIDLQYHKFDKVEHSKDLFRCHFAVIYKAFTPEQLASVQDEFLQVQYNMLSQMPKLQGFYAGDIELIVSLGIKFVDENPYLNLKNVDTFKKHITLVKDLALTDAMGDGTPVDHLTKCTMKRMVAALTADKENATVLENVFDHLMTTIVQLNKNLKNREFGDHIFAIVCGLFKEMKKFKKEPSDAVLESCLNMISEMSRCGDTTGESSKMVEDAWGGVVFQIKQQANTGGGSNAKAILLVVKDMLLSGKKTFIYDAEYAIDNSKYKKGKVFGWKDLVPDAIMLIDVVGSQPIERMQDNTRDTIRAYATFLDKLLDNLRKAKVTSQIQRALVTCIFNCLESPTTDRNNIASVDHCASVDLTTSNKELVSEVLRRLGKLLDDRGLPWENDDLGHTVVYLIDRVMSSYYGKGNAILPEHNKLLLSIVNTCGDGDSIEEQFYQHEEPDKPSTYFHMYTYVILKLVVLHAKNKTGQMLAPVIPDLMKWATIAVEEDSDVQGHFLLYMRDIATSMPELLENFLPQMLEMMVNMSDCSQLLWDAINALYGTNPKAVHNRLHDVFGWLDSPIAEHVPYVIKLLDKVSTSHPQVRQYI